MIRMFVHHRVEDYPRWRAAYDAFDEERRGLGVVGHEVYCGVEDSLDVTVTHDFATIDEARSFAGSAQLRAVMHDAGVIGKPEIWFSAQA